MKKTIFIVAALLLGLTSFAVAQVNVTFWVNTSTVPDTITERANIQLRGDPAPLTWDNATGGQLTHVSGDYWTVTLQFPANTDIKFKLFADSENDGDTGWEANVGTGSTNREFTVGASDTTLPLIFYNTVNGRDQWYTPFEDDGLIDVLFRVNIDGWENYDPNFHDIGVRGGVAPLDWGTSILLAPETPSENAGQINYPAANFWSGVIKFPAEIADVPYQFVATEKGNQANAVWENQLGGFEGNRSLPLQATTPDSTLAWKWFGDIEPVPAVNTDEVIVSYEVDVTKAIQDRGFQHGDTLVAIAGYFGTANEAKRTRLVRQGFSNTYGGTDTLITTIGEMLDYQYYIVKNGADVRENYYDFDFQGEPASRAERRRVDVTGATLLIEDKDVSQVSPRRQPTFPNQSTLARDVLVTWEVDLRPAIYQVMAGDTLYDIQGDFHVTDPDSVLQWGAWINGPAVGGWSNTGGDWGLGLQGNLDKKMYDDGTHGDRVAGDSVFTRQVLASPDSLGIGTKGQIGQVYKFGIRGGDNEGGKGGFGNNHLANIDDSGSESTVFTQFGSINPSYYDAWDFDNNRPKPSGPVNVTFWVNTSTVPDTITERSNLQLRGDPAPLTWGNDTGAQLTHVSGDYWTTTLQFDRGTEIKFKIFADSENDGDSGWEANVGTGSTNREFTVGNEDVTLPMIYYNTVDGRDQWYTPFPGTSGADSVDVLFRVNVQSYLDFNPDEQVVGLRGGPAPLDWGTTLALAPESPSDNAGQISYEASNFWSGVLRFAEDDTLAYQFVVSPASDLGSVAFWENSAPNIPDDSELKDGGNRQLILRADHPDTTLYWKWMSDIPATVDNRVTGTVLFQVNVKPLRELGIFDATEGDTLEVRGGFNGWNDDNPEDSIMRESLVDPDIYELPVTIKENVNTDMEYKYFIKFNPERAIWGGADPIAGWEEPASTGGGNRTFVFTGDEQQVLDVQTFNDIFDVIPEGVSVSMNFKADMRCALRNPEFGDPAADTLWADIQDDVWHFFNGTLVPGGTNPRFQYDDADGDSVYTMSLTVTGPIQNWVQYKLNWQDVEEQGPGFSAGRRRVRYARADANGDYAASYDLGVDYYNEEVGKKLLVEDRLGETVDDVAPCDVTTGVRLADGSVPTSYSLGQNYPNPFNPSTTIKYSIVKAGQVHLVLFNALGQKVGELVNQVQQPGTYEVSVDFGKELIQSSASGVYYYQIRTGEFVKTKSMVLVK